MIIFGIGMIGFAGAIMIGVLRARYLMKDIENDYIEYLLDKENKIKNYKKLISNLKIEIKNCKSTQFYGNTNLALEKVSKVITDFKEVE